jgi:hypothetical protein
VLGVVADDPHDSLAADHLALLTDLLDAGSDFHGAIDLLAVVRVFSRSGRLARGDDGVEWSAVERAEDRASGGVECSASNGDAHADAEGDSETLRLGSEAGNKRGFVVEQESEESLWELCDHGCGHERVACRSHRTAFPVSEEGGE